MSPTLILALVLLEAGLCFGNSAWGYSGENGPTHWGETYSGCSGRRQSPIQLSDYTHTKKPRLSWSGYNEYPDSMTLKNNGHSVALTSEGVTPRITTDDGKTYQLDNVHFHWGKKNSEGSEHTIKNQRFSMEMHAVHMRVDDNGDAVAPAEILVTATFFQPTTFFGLLGMNNFAEDLHHVIKAGSSTPVDPFPWSELIVEFHNDFFWYEGSLTTPPCTEAVTFFVQRREGYLHQKQLDRFRKLLNEDGEEMSGNFRPIQKRNGRDIFFLD